jgi:hypothetical protein
MSGVTPAAISLLLIHLKKSNFKGVIAARDTGVAAADASPLVA